MDSLPHVEMWHGDEEVTQILDQLNPRQLDDYEMDLQEFPRSCNAEDLARIYNDMAGAPQKAMAKPEVSNPFDSDFVVFPFAVRRTQ